MFINVTVLSFCSVNNYLVLNTVIDILTVGQYLHVKCWNVVRYKGKSFRSITQNGFYKLNNCFTFDFDYPKNTTSLHCITFSINQLSHWLWDWYWLFLAFIMACFVHSLLINCETIRWNEITILYLLTYFYKVIRSVIRIFFSWKRHHLWII